jgi:hypothetical protein
MTVVLSDIDAALAAALRDPRLLGGMTSVPPETLAAAAARHGICAVLLQRAAAAEVPLGAVGDRLRIGASGEAAAAALRDAESIRVIAHLHRAGIPHVVIKGLALAYTVYAQPWFRPRSDTDLLVKEDDVARIDEVFRDDGYVLLPHVRGELILPQRHYYKADGRGFQHKWDVHWRLTSSHVLADAPADREVWEHAQRVEAIGGALAPSAPHALMISCVHRLAHHYDDPHLLWLWDIRLLIESMSPADLTCFSRLASRAPAAAAACGRSSPRCSAPRRRTARRRFFGAAREGGRNISLVNYEACPRGRVCGRSGNTPFHRCRRCGSVIPRCRACWCRCCIRGVSCVACRDG